VLSQLVIKKGPLDNNLSSLVAKSSPCSSTNSSFKGMNVLLVVNDSKYGVGFSSVTTKVWSPFASTPNLSTGLSPLLTAVAFLITQSITEGPYSEPVSGLTARLHA